MQDLAALLHRHEGDLRVDVDRFLALDGSRTGAASASSRGDPRAAASMRPKILVCAEPVTPKLVEAAFARSLTCGMPAPGAAGVQWGVAGQGGTAGQAPTIHAVNLFEHLVDLTLHLKGAARFPDVLYLRPRLFRYPDGIAALAFADKRDVALQKLLVLCDRLLCAGEVIELETLYHDHGEAGRAVSRWLGAAGVDTRDAHFAAPAFGKAIRSVAASLRGPLGETGALLPPGSTVPVRRGEPSTLFLERGWCEPEENFAWSTGSLAQVRLPVARSRGRRRCLLRGMRAATDVTVDVSVNGEQAPCLAFTNRPGSDYDILIDLGVVDGDSVRLDLRFPTTVNPHSHDPSNGDTRELAFAIHGIRLLDGERPRHVGWSGRDVAENDVFGSALIYAAWNDPSANEALVLGTRRLLARRVVGGRQPASGRATNLTTWQGDVEGFLRMLEGEGEPIELVVGSERVEDFLAAAGAFTGLSAWLRVCFLIGGDFIREDLRGWILKARFTMVIEESRVLAVPEALTN